MRSALVEQQREGEIVAGGEAFTVVAAPQVSLPLELDRGGGIGTAALGGRVAAQGACPG